ncbi:Dimer_Tnp_hAT domain-containing protein/DUF4371 domain-containing protein [Cinnamomum micranthum f. kanehirae]|uniref:Dimer_Tnp_hAT domain-containing protein/DUF4371 domain-containing protein n=1 Tax=Cinnamomum micranthum f. kanehirae TaxID=337451 RepID=A0A3S3NSG7_9MAGN|nr:Dimer_Tnp_hAT domain-containing protein/DUF4371 domain-containing protein [Cinnamomum micranthum f. kanehirae]
MRDATCPGFWTEPGTPGIQRSPMGSLSRVLEFVPGSVQNPGQVDFLKFYLHPLILMSRHIFLKIPKIPSSPLLSLFSLFLSLSSTVGPQPPPSLSFSPSTSLSPPTSPPSPRPSPALCHRNPLPLPPSPGLPSSLSLFLPFPFCLALPARSISLSFPPTLCLSLATFRHKPPPPPPQALRQHGGDGSRSREREKEGRRGRGNEAIKRVVLENAPENLKLTSPKIQKDIVNAATIETTQAIISKLGDTPFSLLVDESRDISIKEQMAVVIRYVDKRGCVIEWFLAIEHVADTKTQSLKLAIEAIFCRHGLSMSSLRGQGYDGAANMKCELNGLQRLIQNENPTVLYVHCFAHQLQLTLVAVAKDNYLIDAFFESVSMVLNVVGGFCKRHDMLQNIQATKVVDALDSGELESGRGLNQKTSPKRPRDTRWGSHHDTLINLLLMFFSVVDVLEIISDDNISEHKGSATNLLSVLDDFDFAFKLHLMRDILGITNDLLMLLQRKDQNIITAMELVRVSKQRLQTMRDDGWDSLLFEVHSFCEKYEIIIPNMNDMFVGRKRSQRKAELTNLHHFRVDIFYATIDLQLQELNRRFNVVNTELLLCVACLDPSDSFFAFDKEKLIPLSQLYPNDFSDLNRVRLDSQLSAYITDMHTNSKFFGVKGINSLAQKMVETKRDIAYPLIYLLLKLALTLPVATATVERVFSAMKIVKNRLRNRMEDEWMNDCLLVYIEKDIFNRIDDETIMQRFQNTKSRRGQL